MSRDLVWIDWTFGIYHGTYCTACLEGDCWLGYVSEYLVGIISGATWTLISGYVCLERSALEWPWFADPVTILQGRIPEVNMDILILWRFRRWQISAA